MRTLAIDIETYSAADLGKVGVYRYSEDPSFEILLFAYAWDDEPVQIVDLACGGVLPPDVLLALKDPDVIKTAYNAQFERVCLSRYLLDYDLEVFYKPESWSCTAVQARAAGYPNRLGDVTTALGFEADKAKDRRGKALITYFCQPCKPTKVNGGRTRNLPRHDPEKWRIFKEYCRQDVEAERAVREALPAIPDFEQALYEIDQRINDRGVRIDRRFVEAAAALGQSHMDGIADDARHITGLENLNALGAVKDWLQSKGINAETLRKADVERLLDEVDDPEVIAYLQARQELGKTSTTKYDAMLRCACQDDRVRGTLMFCGAGRTGRWAGRLIQTQNLPRNEIEDLPFARQLVMERDARSIEMIYGPVTHVLSQLIRTALVPSDGCHFTVADFSAIEARVIAWLADEDWRLEAFKNHEDIYCSTASKMFKVPVEKHGVNGHLRQKGKIAELACIAEGQMVLTDKGLYPIELVTTSMKVWDGVEWVSHKGSYCTGVKEVIEYEGLEATPDHIVWTEIGGESWPVRLGVAAACGTHLTVSGDRRKAIRTRHDHFTGETMEQDLESLLRSHEMRRVWDGAMDVLRQPETWRLERMPVLLTIALNSEVARPKTYCSEATVYKSQRRWVRKLRRARHQVHVRLRKGGRAVLNRNAGSSGTLHGNRPYRREWELRTGKPSVGYPSGKLRQPKTIYKRVYDILDAGPRRRYTVSGKLVHNCGYGGGPAALKAFGADKMGLTDKEMREIVTQWRAASPHIVKYWWAVDRAAKQAIQTGRTTRLAHNVAIGYIDGSLAIRLPSERLLRYPGAVVAEDRIHFLTPGSSGVMLDTETYGPRLVENIVQATARDCLAEILRQLDRDGARVVFHVHDEVIVETPNGLHRLDEMLGFMREPPWWADGLILEGAGYECEFYQKD